MDVLFARNYGAAQAATNSVVHVHFNIALNLDVTYSQPSPTTSLLQKEAKIAESLSLSVTVFL